MNFFQAQDDARKKTLWLAVLFAAAVLSLILLTNLLVAAVYVWTSNYARPEQLNMVGLLSSLPTQGPFGDSEIGFVGPAGMRITYDTTGDGHFDAQPLIAPSRQQFRQGGIYRLKLTSVPGHEGEECIRRVQEREPD